MTELVIGYKSSNSPTGEVEQQESPWDANGGGGTNVDWAIGAFTGLGGLPAAIDSDADWEAFAAALVAKTSEAYNGGVSVTELFADRFVGVGGGGGDLFAVLSFGLSRIYGRGGNDTIQGYVAPDDIYGGDGADSLSGEGGDDTVSGGRGDDNLNGGASLDTASYLETTLGVRVSLAETGAQNTGQGGSDTLAGFERLIGGSGADRLAGGGGDNTLSGAAGADTLFAEGGNDLLSGGQGVDTADYRAAIGGAAVDLGVAEPQLTGNAGVDQLLSIENLLGSQSGDSLTGDVGANRLDGRGGSDAIAGAQGNDTMIGGFGKDLLTGGEGADVMTGGPGKDRFVFYSIGDSPSDGWDLITDLAADDRILLNNIDAKLDKDGNQAFELVTALTGKSGQAALVYDSGADRTELQLDVDGDGVADGLVLLEGDQRGFVNFAL